MIHPALIHELNHHESCISKVSLKYVICTFIRYLHANKYAATLKLSHA